MAADQMSSLYALSKTARVLEYKAPFTAKYP